KKGISDCYICIGIVHRSQDNYANAIEYYLKSVKIKEELGDKYGMSACYNNIGTIHQHEGSLFVERNDTLNANLAYNKAIKYYLKAIKINKEIGHKQWLSNNYGNIGSIYLDRCFYDKAKEYFLQSLKIFEELGDINSIARIYADLANLYTKIAYCSAEKRVGSMEYNLKQAIEFGNKAITLSREIKALPIENQTADILRIVYKGLKNTAKALEYAEIYISTRDSMFGEEKTEALAEMETRYKAEKRQLQIEKQQVEISRQLVVSSRQRVIILFVVGGLFLVLFFSVFMIRLFLQKKKANIIIAEKNQNLERANAEITAQRDEIAVQRDLVTIQKEHIEEQKKEITDSINYAKRIQQAILPDFSKGFTFGKGESFIDHFVLFKPKDIVSGDFYWSAQVNEWLIVAAVDCTGHGVPGAFMSMLGVSFLNEIVKKKEVTNAAMVLNHLRTSIIEALKQTGEEGTQKDMVTMPMGRSEQPLLFNSSGCFTTD
ncbi:MAG: tetratricopeptide repeat protein, partial [Bacteroidia bacterium]|nr:tetratricopeptide repeat protein [Bacteroidia bacterium]